MRMRTYRTKAGLTLLLLAVGAMAVGCGGGKKAQIQELETQLTQAQQQSAELQSSLDATKQDLAAKEQEVSQLQTSLKQTEQKAAQAEVEAEQAKAAAASAQMSMVDAALAKGKVPKDTMMSVQQALKSAGYDPGPIDGLVGRQTVEAIHSFQKDNGLEVGDLNASTLMALKIPMDKLPKL